MITEKIIDEITDIIYDAGRIIKRAHDIDNVTKSKEGSANYVTAYDVEVQKFLYENLSRVIPGAAFIGEESTENHPELIARGTSFIIDPIDGTTNFICDYKCSAISIGICEQGTMMGGVVYNPYSGELWHAVRGGGAYLGEQRIHISNRPLSESIVLFGSSPYYRAELADRTFDTAKKLFLCARDIRRSGSAAIDLCYIACGRGDIFFEYRLSPWDYAASQVIIEEAGGRITDMNGQKLTYEHNCSVLAAGNNSYDEVLKLIHTA